MTNFMRARTLSSSSSEIEHFREIEQSEFASVVRLRTEVSLNSSIFLAANPSKISKTEKNEKNILIFSVRNSRNFCKIYDILFSGCVRVKKLYATKGKVHKIIFDSFDRKIYKIRPEISRPKNS